MRYIHSMILAVAVLFTAKGAMADTFGTGGNQFTIDFVPISGATNPTSGIPAGYSFTFTGVDHDYRMGTFEVSNDQWNKFTASLGVPVTGDPWIAYGSNSYFRGLNVPTDRVSWYEAAQFVNWLNTSTSHQAAYKFTGTQGTEGYAFAAWSTTDIGYDAGNPYRNKDAFYYLPTKDEWVKAAYWNGTALQTYATKAGESLTQGDGVSGTGWNYYYGGHASYAYGPWNVGSGSEELNGTYDMMGNVWEWMESPGTSGDYGAGSMRGLRGGSWDNHSFYLAASDGGRSGPSAQTEHFGFRVASVPEPGSLTLVLSGAIAALIWWRRRK